MKLPALFGEKTAPTTQRQNEPTEPIIKKRSQSSNYSRADWDRFIMEWEESGLTQKQFCKQRKLNLKTFAGQRTRLLKTVRNKKDLIPVEISDIPIQAPAKKDRFILECATGEKLIIPNNFDKKSLRELLSVLGVC